MEKEQVSNQVKYIAVMGIMDALTDRHPWVKETFTLGATRDEDQIAAIDEDLKRLGFDFYNTYQLIRTIMGLPNDQ